MMQSAIFLNKSTSMLAVTDWYELENSLLRGFFNQSLCRLEDIGEVDNLHLSILLF